jgi:hypothetical protein
MVVIGSFAGKGDRRMKGNQTGAWILLSLLAVPAGIAWGAPAGVEFRAGHFSPASGDFRDVYKGGLAFGADFTVPLWKALGLWGGVDYFGKKGKLTYTEEETTIRILPVFLGLKLQAVSGVVRPYFAGAAGYFFYKEMNSIGTASGQRLGFLVQAGLLVRIKGPLALDLSGRMSSCTTKAEEPDVSAAKIGGFQGGLGISLDF